MYKISKFNVIFSCNNISTLLVLNFLVTFFNPACLLGIHLPHFTHKIALIFSSFWSPSITDDDDFLFNIESGFYCG